MRKIDALQSEVREEMPGMLGGPGIDAEVAAFTLHGNRAERRRLLFPRRERKPVNGGKKRRR